VVNDVQTASLSYVSFNASNQVTLPKGWSAELSGFYRGREQELQEVTFAYGQVSAGVAKQLWKNKATLRLSVRDIFYTGYTQGLTMFQRSEEYFRLQRDLRVATLAFSWRFGKAVRDTRKRNGSAGEEIRRVGV
jgi:iron complex outermembrane receptor protein